LTEIQSEKIVSVEKWVGPKEAKQSRSLMTGGILLQLLLIASVLLIWDLLVVGLEVAVYIVPRPFHVAQALWNGLAVYPLSPQSYYYHAYFTLLSTIGGFVIGSIAGVVLGIVIAESPFLERHLFPYVVAIRSIPKLALAPLFIIWFGFGLAPKIATVTLMTFFPVAVNSIEGFRAIERDRIQLMRSLSASRWQIFTMVKFPSALPFIFAGLNIGLQLAVTAAIVAEFVGSQQGLGILLLNMNQLMDVAGSFSVVVVLALIGIGLNAITRSIQKKIVFWAPDALDKNESL
jgi:NitT/TauT family transport system permease protein